MPIRLLDVPGDVLHKDVAPYLPPLRWLSFSAYIITGVHGALRRHSDCGFVDVDLDDDFVPGALYCFFATSPITWPLDPEIESRVTSSDASGREETRAACAARDHDMCIVTGFPNYHCQGAHLVPRRKGNAVDLTPHLHRTITQ